jgi:hypothetical protein
MPPRGHDPAWPDKAMFAAILLILAGFVGAAFELARPLIEVDQERLPTVFTDDIPGYTLGLCLATIVAGVLSLRRQAALFAYVGAVLAMLSLGVFGLVPGLGLLAVATMVKSHLEGEETRDDGVELSGSLWPDKAMAASLFLVVVGAIAMTQGILMLAGRFDPIVWQSAALAGWLAVAVAVGCFAAARELYHVRRPWMGWVAFVLGVGTLGFYAIGPVMALVGMLLLGLAHREQEFILHGSDGDLPAGTVAAAPMRRGRRRRPVPAA